MSIDTQFSLTEPNADDEAINFGSSLPAKFLPPLKNYAEWEPLKLWVAQELTPVLDETRAQRLVIESEWDEISKMAQMQHGPGRRYYGRSDMVLPIYRRERDKLVSALSKGLFPSEDYFDVQDRRTGDPSVAAPVKFYMQWELERNARVRAFIKPFLYNFVDFGTAVMKFWYRKELKPRGVKEATGLKIPGLESISSMKKTKVEGLAVSPRRLNYWYLYPWTAESLDEAQVVFEDIDVSAEYLRKMERLKRYVNVEKAINNFNQSDHALRRQSALAARGLPDIPSHVSDLALSPTLTEVWTFAKLPRSEYMDWENENDPVPVRIVLAGDVILEARRNPFFHQQTPYVVARSNWEPGVFYGSGMGATMKALQLLATDFMNQTNDNGILGLNPITLINPGLMQGPPRPFAPGVPWLVADVDKAVRFERPPTDQVSMGIQMANLLIGMAQQSSSAPPDQSTRSQGSKTATGMQILQRNAAIPLQDSVEDIELDVMVPMLMRSFHNAVQFRDQQVMAAVAGQQMQIDPEMLAIDADFTWMASSQTANNQVRSQQAMSLIQMLAPLLPVLQQQGAVVNFVPLLKKIYTEGFGFRGFDQFIQPMQPPPMQVGAPGGMPPPGGQPPPGGRMRSAVEQADGMGNVEAQPGEAEDFMEVRANADDMAGDMGGLSQMGGGL